MDDHKDHNQDDHTHGDSKRIVICPECQNDIPLEDGRKYEVGDIIECQICGTELEVVKVDEDGNVLEVEIIEEEK